MKKINHNYLSCVLQQDRSLTALDLCKYVPLYTLG